MGFSLNGSDFETDAVGHRLLRSVDLREVSIVSAFPAYETSVKARSSTTATLRRNELLNWLKGQEQ